MLFGLCLVLFAVHNALIFWYFSHLFLRTDRNGKLVFLALGVNTLAFACFLLTLPYEGLLMLVSWALLTGEIKLIFKEGWVKVVFGAMCFSLNYFAVKLFFTVVYALAVRGTITAVMGDRGAAMTVAALTLGVNIPYTLAFHRFFPKNHMDSILSDRGNLKFVCAIVGLIYLYLMVNARNLYLPEGYSLMPLVQLKIAVCGLMGFSAAFFYAFLFARLRLYAERSQEIQREAEAAERATRALEDEAFHDGFTGCYTRAYGERELDRLLAERVPFSLLYLDMDGLKATNDTYGHGEGDFYIRTTSDILRRVFAGRMVARVGGDEFLVLLEGVDSYAAARYAVRCYDSVRALSGQYRKPYQTSISYGIVEVTAENDLPRGKLLELADGRMYSFKRSKQRNRGSHRPG